MHHKCLVDIHHSTRDVVLKWLLKQGEIILISQEKAYWVAPCGYPMASFL